MKRKKIRTVNALLAVLILVLPLLLFANVWYSFRAYQLREQIREQEEEQIELIEKNKRLITGIAVLRSPSRIIEEARKLGMNIPSEGQVIVIQENDF